MSSAATGASQAGSLEKAAQLLAKARYAVAFTGAGISTPSGIPDFRSAGSGLWEKFDPMEVASLRSFEMRPERFYDWLRPLLKSIWAAEPNPAHFALAQLEEAGILKAVITQNIDDLHERAGSRQIHQVHGSLRSMTCTHCQEVYPSQRFEGAITGTDKAAGLPRCPVCGSVMKPDITLFGEMLPMQTWELSERHCEQADLMLVVGSSLEVWPANALPQLAVENGAVLIINTYSTTPLDAYADVLLRGDVAEILPQLVTGVFRYM